MYPQCPAEGAADTFSPSPRREHPYTAAGEKQRCGSPSIGQKECGKGTRHFVTRHRTTCSLRGNKVFLRTEQVVSPEGTKRSAAETYCSPWGNTLLPAGEPSVSAAGTRHKGKREGLYPRIRYVKIQTLSLCRRRRMLRALSRDGVPRTILCRIQTSFRILSGWTSSRASS